MNLKSISRLRKSKREGREIEIHGEANYYAARAADIHYLHHEKHILYFVINERGRVVSVNHLLALYLGYECEELVGKSVGVLIHNNDLDVDEFDHWDSGTARRLIIQRIDHTEFWLIVFSTLCIKVIVAKYYSRA